MFEHFLFIENNYKEENIYQMNEIIKNYKIIALSLVSMICLTAFVSMFSCFEISSPISLIRSLMEPVLRCKPSMSRSFSFAYYK